MTKKKSPKKKVKKTLKKASPKKVARFKCQHCNFAAKSKGGLGSHNKSKHGGKKSKVGERIEGKTAFSPLYEKFCQLYASDREFLGNGTQSYIESHDVSIGKGDGCVSYEYCKYRASILLKRRDILKRIDEIYSAGGLNDAHVDKQLEFIITQKAELRTSLGGIVEYNKLKKRTVDTVQHVHAFADIKGLSDKELSSEKEKLQNFFNKK